MMPLLKANQAKAWEHFLHPEKSASPVSPNDDSVDTNALLDLANPERERSVSFDVSSYPTGTKFSTTAPLAPARRVVSDESMTISPARSNANSANNAILGDTALNSFILGALKQQLATKLAHGLLHQHAKPDDATPAPLSATSDRKQGLQSDQDLLSHLLTKTLDPTAPRMTEDHSTNRRKPAGPFLPRQLQTIGYREHFVMLIEFLLRSLSDEKALVVSKVVKASAQQRPVHVPLQIESHIRSILGSRYWSAAVRQTDRYCRDRGWTVEAMELP